MIFVTGGTGFVGSHLLYLLAREGRKIRVLKRKDSSLNQVRAAFDFYNTLTGTHTDFEQYTGNFEWVECDLLLHDSMYRNLDDVDEIYHAAANISHDDNQRNEIDRVNIRGTTDLVNMALEKGIEKFHYVSSIAALDRNEEGIISESKDIKKVKFTSAYSKSKYLAEIEVWRGFEEGLKGVIINPGLIIGPGDPSSESLGIFKLIRDGFNYYPSGSSGYVDVRDVAECLFRLSKNENYFQQRYLLVAETMSYHDVFDKIARYFGVNTPAREARKSIALLVSFLDGIRSKLSGKGRKITPGIARVSSQNYHFDNRKIMNTLDYKFIDIDKSIMETCDFLKKNYPDLY